MSQKQQQLDYYQILFGLTLFMTTFSFVVSNVSQGKTECSGYFAFNQLCPNPILRHFPGTNYEDSTKTPVIFINLEKYDGKERQVPPCSFYESQSLLGGIHITHTPWDFTHSKQCSHHIMFFHDERDEELSSLICRKMIGVRLSNRVANEDSQSRAVYYWRNFTLTSTQITFSDTITNPEASNYEITTCPNMRSSLLSDSSRKPLYVQMVILTTVYSECVLLIQQYKLEPRQTRSCNGYNPYYEQFCGTYDCAHSNNILMKMKLFRNITGILKERATGSTNVKTSSKHESYNPSKITIYPTIPTTTEPDHENDKTAVELERQVSWKERIAKWGFPMIAIIGILIVFGRQHIKNRMKSHKNGDKGEIMNNVDMYPDVVGLDAEKYPISHNIDSDSILSIQKEDEEM